jgi:hypothetical protein
VISEKQLAESFDSFWQQHFPLLNPTFIRQINLEKQRVVARDSRPMLPVPMGKAIDRFDLVAELAFEAAREGYRTKRSLSGNFEQASARAMAKIAKFTGVSEIPPPSFAETAEAKSQGEVYDAFFSSIPTNETVTLSTPDILLYQLWSILQVAGGSSSSIDTSGKAISRIEGHSKRSVRSGLHLSPIESP